jgi:hypothetical protein
VRFPTAAGVPLGHPWGQWGTPTQPHPRGPHCAHAAHNKRRPGPPLAPRRAAPYARGKISGSPVGIVQIWKSLTSPDFNLPIYGLNFQTPDFKKVLRYGGQFGHGGFNGGTG